MTITRRFKNPDTGKCEVFDLTDYKLGFCVWTGQDTGREILKPCQSTDEC